MFTVFIFTTSLVFAIYKFRAWYTREEEDLREISRKPVRKIKMVHCPKIRSSFDMPQCDSTSSSEFEIRSVLPLTPPDPIFSPRAPRVQTSYFKYPKERNTQ